MPAQNGRLTVNFDDQRVVLDYAGADAASVVAFVCRSLSTAPSDDAARIELRQENDAMTLTVDGITDGTYRDRFDAADALMRELTRLIVWDYRNGLALHGALVSIGEQQLLFPASSGAGKSTLATYVGAHAQGCHSDELVFSPRGSTDLLAFKRPVHLKKGSLFVLETLASVEAWVRDRGALIAPAALGANVTTECHPLKALVFPRYVAEASVVLERLSAAGASFALLGALVNARNLPGDGVPMTSALARSVPAFRLTYGKLPEALETLKNAVAGI